MRCSTLTLALLLAPLAAWTPAPCAAPAAAPAFTLAVESPVLYATGPGAKFTPFCEGELVFSGKFDLDTIQNGQISLYLERGTEKLELDRAKLANDDRRFNYPEQVNPWATTVAKLPYVVGYTLQVAADGMKPGDSAGWFLAAELESKGKVIAAGKAPLHPQALPAGKRIPTWDE